MHSALVAGDGPVAEFLADAEPPAHDTWTLTSRLRQRWRYAQQTLTLIRTLPQRLHALLATGADQELPDELLDYFWFEDEGEQPSGRERGGRRAPRRTPPPPKGPPAPRPRQLVVLEEKGGFTLKAGPGLADDALPCRIRLRMAYDRENKDPIRAWSRYDFDLADDDGEIEVETEGAEIVEQSDNTLLVEARDRAFRVRLSGFDVNRDLEVRCHRLREDTA